MVSKDKNLYNMWYMKKICEVLFDIFYAIINLRNINFSVKKCLSFNKL